jgi:hypothetical protein
MNRRGFTPACAALLGLCIAASALAHDPPDAGCGAFSRDVAPELATMRLPALPENAQSHGPFPQLLIGKHYALSLLAQDQLKFRVKPGHQARAESPRGGAFEFTVAAAGRYRVSITSRHWIDIVDGQTVVTSLEHFGPGCELVHKIVEFELPAGRPLTLQLSGQDDAIIGLAITPVPSS